MAGRVQWRRFGFFDRDTVNENIEGTLGSSPTCACADGGILLFGDGKGNISMTDRNFNISWTHRAFAGPVRGVAYVYDLMNHKRQYVVAIGEEPRPTSSNESKTASTREPYVIKVFATSDLTHPIQAFLASNPTVQDNSTLTGFAVTSNGYQIAIGFSSGAVLLFSGNFLAEGSVGRQFNPQTLLHGHKYAVTGLYFCELNFNSIKTSTSDRNVRLFAVLGGEASGGNSSTQQPHSDPEIADAGILAFDTSFSTYGGGIGGAINRSPTRVLDFAGATSECSSLMKQTYELVVGREEGVFTYSIEDRGGAAGFEGEKQCIAAVGRYILVGCIDEKTKRTLITIYDLRNKFISMSYLLPLGETIRMVLSDGGVAYVITSSWSLIRFREKDTANKLDVLLRKSLYPLAISLAAEEQSDVNEVMRLYKMYADHLYKKNDFDGSITQYCHTIGFVQPSYVIRRFLDTQRINNLTVYLEKLHQKGLATKDHTTLLLTCYTKTNNTVKLSEFCQMNESNGTGNETAPGATGGGTMPLNYDILTAIYTLHDAGFDEHALRLSVLNNKHEEYLHISLSSKTATAATAVTSAATSSATNTSSAGKKDETTSDVTVSSSASSSVDNALVYLLAIITLGDLSISVIIDIIYKFGSLFLKERPVAFTSLLIQLCVGTLNRQQIRELLLKESTTANDPSVSSSVSSFSASVLEVESEVENLLTQKNKGGPGGAGGSGRQQKKGAGGGGAGVSNSSSSFMLADCFPLEDALSVYADDEKYLRIFIEGVNEGMRKVNATMPSRLTELLLELYLVEYQSIRDQIQASRGGATRVATSGGVAGGPSGGPRVPSVSIPHSSHVELLNKLKSIEDKVLAILDGASSVNTEYDISNALLLMHSFDFENGEMFLIEKLQSTDLILRRCIETGNERGIMRILRREGRKDPELFVQVLTYFVRLSMTSSSVSASSTSNSSDATQQQQGQGHRGGDVSRAGMGMGADSDDEDDCDDSLHHYDDDERWELINEVLILVERENVLTPMQIIPILSQNPDLPLHLASRFIKRTLKETSDELITLEREVSHMKRIVQGVIQEGIAARQHKLNQQAAAETAAAGGGGYDSRKGAIRGGNMTSRTGSMTGGGVSGESDYYNDHGDEDELERQQAEAEREVERTKWLGIKNAQEKRTNDHESFFGELEHCSDGFGTIAAYFGKTIIS